MAFSDLGKPEMALRAALFLASLLLFAGCSPTVPLLQIETACDEEYCTPQLKDLEHFPQQISRYVGNAPQYEALLPVQEHYAEEYYRVWDADYIPKPLESLLWPFRTYRADNAYGENLQPLPLRWFDAMLARANWKAYNEVGRRAIALTALNLRNFPTAKPLFRDPRSAGEGFPFDYLQNSSVFPNEPLYVSHYSADRAWVYVLTSYATGWVPAEEIAFLDDSECAQWRSRPMATLLADKTPVYTGQGDYLFRGNTGMLLPIETEGPNVFTVDTVVPKGLRGGELMRTTLSKSVAAQAPMRFSHENLQRVIGALMRTQYGWGGYYGERDCSSTLRDIFAPFGIWLPRNSFRQSQVGEVVSLEGLDNAEKLARIREWAVPFQTLFYLKGHILLYLGIYDGEPAVLHTFWGVKTISGDAVGRFVVGRTIISSLHIGREIEGYRKENSLLSKLLSMNNIFRQETRREIESVPETVPR